MTSTFGLPSFAVEEVDDLMEVSSEHGPNPSEDIDIDLDLTAGHADEDFVLEDATSTIGMDDDTQPPRSPSAGNDELMIDESEGQYNGHNQDLDELILDEGANSIDDQFSSAFFNSTTSSGMHIEGFEDGNVPIDISEAVIEHHSEPAKNTNEESTHIDEQLSSAEEAVEVAETVVPTLPDETNVGGPPPNASRVSTPHEDVERRSMKSHPTTSPGSPKEVVTQSTTGSNTPNSPQENGKVVDSLAAAREVSSLEVIATYQDSEFALFSTSESDDPDSFFLSDVSVIDKPLSSFFKAIRDVIHEDLANDDELCVVVNELGLEIMEVNFT